jgi:hypothetical protein
MTQLINIVRFNGLVVGVPVAQAHSINVNGQAQTPDLVIPSIGGFTVTVDATNVTVTMTAATTATAVDVYVQRWHSYLRSFGPFGPSQPANLAPLPLVVQPGVGGGSTSRIEYAVAAEINPITLVDAPAGVVAVDGSLSDYFILTGDGLGSTRQLANPTNLVAGERRVLIFEWVHAGVDTLTFAAGYRFGDPGAPAYPAAGTTDLITAVWNGTNMICSYVQGY